MSLGTQKALPSVLPEEAKNASIDTQEASSSKRIGNRFSKGLAPDMLSHPYMMGEPLNVRSDHFCFEKTMRYIAYPLDLRTREDWLIFAENAWDWHESKESRQSVQNIKAEIAKLGLEEEKAQNLVTQLKLELGIKD